MAATGETVMVRAREAQSQPVRRLNYRERIAPSLWYVPGLFVAGSAVLSKVTVAVDRARDVDEAPRWLLGADSAAAASLTAVVATAMLSFVAVVFTTTLVAIQLASGQYSPRVVRIFVRSRLSHLTMGLFLATFVFALNSLVEIRSGAEEMVPAITVSVVYLSVLLTLAAFITFVHGMSRMLRVQHLLAEVTAGGRSTVLANFPPEHVWAQVEAPRPGNGPVQRNTRRVGVVQAVDHRGLVERCRQAGVVLEVLVEAGEYVGVGTPVTRLLDGPAGPVDGDEVVRFFLLGPERTLVHDPGFVVRQLVDVAIRALSPAVNDPTTAVQVVDRLNDLLGDVAGRPDPTGWYVDSTGTARLRVPEPGFERLLRLAYVEIIRYGADSPQVVRRVRAALDVLEPQVRADVVPAVQELRSMLDDAMGATMPPAFRSVSAVADRHGLG